jgi:hypothetical protein
MTAPSVTTFLRVTPISGKEEQLLKWFHTITSEAETFQGYEGSELFQPCPGSGEWKLDQHFYL